MMKEKMMNLDSVSESDAYREFRTFFEGLGEARGEARMVLQVLTLRGFAVDDGVRERVMACTDREKLAQWLARGMTATSLADVFVETP
jgi:hypothetical protein